ncbi:glycoside hydrolase family 127 protein [Terrimonas sp. NA20]|uniref:Glycoside hydrolase family 127 protein n=1 Tax=Terrimonas ginsenosidimutans TaxID=2908004 RepID=A0ABS9KR45_9BACT|nr:glycoside hydrolase family 127 protein [Terrimonas ginsenosidimutans]MCG2614796.1 glycoside hydrolase family 127 protein [Terrimonas ginsenosidimutans]
MMENICVGLIKNAGRSIAVLLLTATTDLALAQDGLTNTTKSQHAVLSSTNLGDVKWTSGFWADRFKVTREVTVPQLWNTYLDPKQSHSFRNFEIAAGLDTGNFKGPSFHDGDFYKTLEAVAALYATTKDPELDKKMDAAIAVIAKAQKDDGYIYTKSIIEQRKTGKTKMFDDKLSFEAYNFGHLMTAACVHYRATGKTSLLNVAKKATDFLIVFYTQASPEQARNAICPSHYMGIVEMYRTTGEQKYLQLVKKLIDIRGTVEGTDDNSDRAPVREMNKVVGHAVRANYLFAGIADLYAETGDTSLMSMLNRMWDNVVNRKMYITGGCGALYDGVSVDGTSYKPDTVQKVHQSYGRDYQLPSLSAHNETCANIGNVLWNWRMFQLTADAKYADIVELALYNSVLSGINLEGTKFFYTNPLASRADYPYHLRWEGERQEYIGLSNCCPPNTVRTLAEINNYMYSIADDGLYVNLYGGNELNTKLKDGSALQIQQVTNYPWEGNVTFNFKQVPTAETGIYLRLPGWCKNSSIKINGKPEPAVMTTNGNYILLKRKWKAGDVLQFDMEMPAVLVESNPLVEESRNQVAVKRGPLVYCLESADLPKAEKLQSVLIPSSIVLKPVPSSIAGQKFMGLKGTAVVKKKDDWNNKLYRELNSNTQNVTIQLIPYYAWANRGRADMSVWLPLTR